MIGSFSRTSHAVSLEESQESAGALISNTKDLAKAQAEQNFSSIRGLRSNGKVSAGTSCNGVGESEMDMIGSFIFIDGDLIGTSINHARRGIDRGSFMDKLRNSAAQVLGTKSISAVSASGESERGIAMPIGIYEIRTKSNMGCRISNIRSTPIDKNIDAVLFNRISNRVTVLSCVMAAQQVQIIPTADEGPGTVHGCFCYRVCPPRMDARDSCYTVCSCWNSPS